MSTTLITADWHLDNSQINEHRHTFVMETLPTLLKEHNCDQLIILGDLCEKKDHHGADLVNRVVNEIVELAKICGVIILRGNHDYIKPDSPFFKFLDQIKNVMWVNIPRIYTEQSMAFLPHTRNYKKDWERLNFKNLEYIFAHQTFAEANKFVEGIPLEVFPAGARIISGDIHPPQTIMAPNGTGVHYVGAPYTKDFGDDYNPRVLIIKERQTMKSISVPGPRKVLFNIDDTRQLPLAGLNNDLVKVRVNIDSFENWAALKEEILAWGEHVGCSVHSITPIITPQKNHKGMRNFKHKSDEEQVRAYAKKRNVPEKTLEIGIKLLGK